ncbi:MAG: peptide deformylase [Candidatus Vogelbacteria bacterium GWA1_51_14]|uniref:Peptide deformylase n=1 Tax=Candidatus Vogelbacteria bacterium GWA1_51_14 TaxID=1802435 RepID=A0A1G2QB50_9BACT|nr:MAG: peptide deformylase [Candidatus Vogelbacteria bacterium GWA1_51_14]
MVKIVAKDDPTLRNRAETVKISEIKSAKIQKILKTMSAALAREADGVALAAPQIGVPLRIFIITGKLLEVESPLEGPISKSPSAPDLVFINPQITKMSKRKVAMEEGCLSVRWWYGEVKRADKVTITAYNEQGRKFTRHGTGLWAQIFQHETDHLEGILFTDKAENLREIDQSQLHL